jgi:thiol-disulfide isomerase/thioredoxin
MSSLDQNLYEPTPTPPYLYQPTPTPPNPYEYQPTPTPPNPYQPTPTPPNPYLYQPTPTPQYTYQPTPTPQYTYQPTPTPQYTSTGPTVFIPQLDPKKSIQGITGNLVYSDIAFDKDGTNPTIYNKNLTKGKPGMLFIHATWCPHCTRFSPIYRDACQKLNAKGLIFPCLAIESSQLTQNLSRSLDFSGFPTIKFFDQNGNILPGEYEGDRTVNGLLSAAMKLLNERVGPTATPSGGMGDMGGMGEIADVVRIDGITANLSDVDFIVNQNGQPFVRSSHTKGKPGLLFIHASWCPHCTRFIPTYKSLCSKLNNGSVKFPCLAIESDQLKNNRGLAKALQIQGFPTIKFFDQNGKILGDYNGNRDENSLLNAVRQVCKECARGLNF